MNIAVLSRGPNLYSTQRLLIAGQRRGHQMYLIDYSDCSLHLDGGRPVVCYKEEPIDYVDAILPRIGASGTSFGAAVLQQFEGMGVTTVLSSKALQQSRDKLHSLQLLSNAGIRFPKTVFGSSNEAADYMVESVGGPPVVIKLVKGTHGLGVVLAKDLKTAETIIETFQQMRQRFLVQEFIAEAKGEDVRAFVVGGKVVAAMKRRALPGEFRSNLHRGGSSIHIKLTGQEIETALKAVQILGLEVAGVDMLQSDKGPLIMEVNASPGLEGIETTTNIDVADHIIAHLETIIA